MERTKVFYIIDSQKLFEVLKQVINKKIFKQFMKGIRFGRAKLISIIQSGRIPEYLGNRLINLVGTDDFVQEVEIIDRDTHSKIPYSLYKTITH